MRITAYRYVLMKSPPPEKFAKEIGITLKQLKDWMATPFWDSCILYAEHEEELRKRRRDKAPSGAGIPKHLLEQAVVLWLAGWSREYIAPMIGRAVSTLRNWELTIAWEDMKERVMLDKLRMALIDNHLTLRQILSEVAARHEDELAR